MVVKPKATICFFFKDVSYNLRNRKKLKEFISYLFKKEKKNLRVLNYVFCSDEFLLGINQKYLRHDFYTDIITFDISNSKTEISGEVYISLDRMKENSSLFKVTFLQELLRVVLHGALHLSGYSDKRSAEKKLMRQKEDYYLDMFQERSTWKRHSRK